MNTKLALMIVALTLTYSPTAFPQVSRSIARPPDDTANQSATSFSSRNFHLGGIWQWESHINAPKVRLIQNGDTLNIFLQEAKSETLIYKGRYVSPSLVQGQELSSLGRASPEQWTSKAIYVDDPDHIRFERGAPFVRVSEPLPSDVICDLQNSSHVKADFALARAMGPSGKNAATEIRVCWIHASALEGNPEAQYATSMIYRKGIAVAKDEPTAFLWAQKSATGGSLDGEELLAELYTKGIGTTSDPQKAKVWLAKAKLQREQEAEAAWKNALLGAMAPLAAQALQNAQNNIQQGLPTEEESRKSNEENTRQMYQDIEKDMKDHPFWGH